MVMRKVAKAVHDHERQDLMALAALDAYNTTDRDIRDSIKLICSMREIFTQPDLQKVSSEKGQFILQKR